MTTTSSNQLQDGFSGVQETSQASKTQGECVRCEEASSSEHELVSEEEEVSQINIYDNSDMNVNHISIHELLRHSDSNPKTTARKLKILSRRERTIRKALDEFRSRLENVNSFLNKDDNTKRDITLWGVPLLPSKGHQGTNTILLKFLKAQDYRVSDAFEMLRQTLIWRENEGIDHILEEKLQDEIDSELSKVVFTDSFDKDGHPLCFSLYGPFKDNQFYSKVFGTEENREQSLRWKIQFMEKNIKRLNFSEGINSFVFISDMKNAPSSRTRVNELSLVSKDLISLFQRHYPELIFKHIIINTPFWYNLYHGMISQYCTHGTKDKFVFARPHKVTETLLKYIPPQNIPIQYGGLRCVNDEEFGAEDEPQEFSLRARALTTFQIPISEGKVTNTIVWEVMVVGWDVTYKDEFIPYDEGSYKMLFLNKKMKMKMIGQNVRNSFYVKEPGKILITIRNATYIKKRAFIRHKAKLTLPPYMSTPQPQPQMS